MLGAHGSGSNGALLEPWQTCSATVLTQHLASIPFSTGLGQPFRVAGHAAHTWPEAQALNMHAADAGWCCMLPQTAAHMQAACTRQKLMLCMLHLDGQQATCRLQAVLSAGFRLTWLPSPRRASCNAAPWPGPCHKVCAREDLWERPACCLRPRKLLAIILQALHHCQLFIQGCSHQ